VSHHLGDVEELLERVDPDHTGMVEQGIDRSVGASERGGVRRRRPDPGTGPPALDRDDGFGAGDAPGEPSELAGVPEGLEVQEDDVGIRIVLPILQQVVPADVGLVPE
jgi:hypothetical protein